MSKLASDRHLAYQGIVEHAITLRQISEAELAELDNTGIIQLAYQIAEQAQPAYNIPWQQLRDGIRSNLTSRVYKARGKFMYPR